MRGRFAPSPTGDLHLGNLRTALLAWLWSRRDGSGFLVRMEDLDRVTSSVENEARQLDDLAAIGLDWDPPVVRQSGRFDLYRAAIAELDARGLVYPCYCTRREIAEAVAAPNAPVTAGYPGTCRELTERRRRELESEGRPPAFRLRAQREPIAFDDDVTGRHEGVPDDVVLQRNDGVPAYHLAVVVDDDAQGVEIVVRGDDLLPSTPSQIHLADLLDARVPRYAHVPLVLGPDHTRLAKRDGAVTLGDRAALGDSPDDVVAFLLGSAGILPGPLDEVAERFDPADLRREPFVVPEHVLTASLRSPA